MLDGAGVAAGPVSFFAEGVDTSDASCCFSFRWICWLWTHSKVHCLLVLTQFVHGPNKSSWSSVPGVVLVSPAISSSKCPFPFPPAPASTWLFLGAREYLHDSKWLVCPAPAGAL